MTTDPATAIERRLAPIWMKVLHIDAAEYGASFVSLGGDPRAAKAMVEEIRFAFDIAVALRILLEMWRC